VTRTLADDRRRAAGKICVYCGLERLDGRQRPEHPIPRVMGSRLTVFTACDECNEEVGKRVDAPWLGDIFVQSARADAGVADPRHKAGPIKDPLLNGVFLDDDGHRVVVENGVPRYPGSIARDGNKVTIAAATEERADALLARLKRQLAEEGNEVAEFSRSVRNDHQPRLSRAESTRVTQGVRMGAKLGLAFAAEVYDEGWRQSAEAQRLREWLWSDRPTDADGGLLGWTPYTSEPHPFADPPTHVAYFGPVSDATALTVLVLGGKLPFTVPVGPSGQRPQTAWRIPIDALPERTTFDRLVLAAASAQQRDLLHDNERDPSQ
jgi:hypothetical protein